ncbi:MAG: FAD-dependent oxidoreductase [Pseudomonadota bacterium]
MDQEHPSYDVIVVGAGPAGCEAAMAAGAAGARVLCISMNLDTAGFPPGSPLLVAGEDDERGDLLRALRRGGGALPRLLEVERVGAFSEGGALVVDRRELGLAWKEAVESAPGVELRQAEAVSIERRGEGASWLVGCRLGELFESGAVILCAGTFLSGVTEDGAEAVGGGRRCESASEELPGSLRALGLALVEMKAVAPDRIILPGPDDSAPPQLDERLKFGMVPDGAQLGEWAVTGIGSRVSAAVGASRGSNDTTPGRWTTRAAYSVRHLGLAASQIGERMESVRLPGLFLAGRCAGASGYVESAVSGWVAGREAAAEGSRAETLIDEDTLVTKLCHKLARSTERPVSAHMLADTT